MKGFSIIELLVVTAIIGILSVIVLANYPVAKQQLALQRAATKLAQDIRRVQEMAIASAECKTCPPPDKDKVPETGYGAYIVINPGGGYTTTYKLYADTGGAEEAYSASDYIIEEIELEKGVYIFAIPESAPKKVSINFKPPDPEVAIKWVGGGTKYDNVSIVLCRKGADCTKSINTKTIYVNRAGLISVK